MDIEQLIERLNAYSAEHQQHGGITAEAADAISTLRAELKSNVDSIFRQAKELDRRHLLLQEQEAELEQVKRERDAIEQDFRAFAKQWWEQDSGFPYYPEEPCEPSNCVFCNAVEDAPDVDAEPVVHCSDCLYLMFSDCYGECKRSYLSGIVRPDDYCSRGLKKEDNT